MSNFVSVSCVVRNSSPNRIAEMKHILKNRGGETVENAHQDNSTVLWVQMPLHLAYLEGSGIAGSNVFAKVNNDFADIIQPFRGDFCKS